jgi:glyoxylase-like metal-dependent hydrolase (beta-lactamase superfamily II)
LTHIISKEELKPKVIILTHYHYDHILAVEDIKKQYNIPVYIHENGVKGLKDSIINLSELRPVPSTSIEADKALVDGEVVEIGEMKLEIIYTPGHTSSDICIKCGDILITGDTLFKNSVGRSDFEESSYENLKSSVLNKLMVLNDDIKIYPGHYESSTIGQERRVNTKIKMMMGQ